MPTINFKVHKDKKTYQKIIKSIKGIPKKVGARKINKLISEKINFTLLPMIFLSKESLEIMPIFRVRTLRKNEHIIDETNPDSFKYPPKNKIKMGRANRNHHQVLYTSLDFKTAFCECEKQINKHKSTTYLSVWGIKDCTDKKLMRNFCLGIKPRDDSSPSAEIINYINQKIDEFIKNDDYKYFKENILYAQKLYTELFLTKGSRFYHISSAIVYNTFVHALEQKADIPIISYPSVAMKHSSLNFAFRSDFVEKYMYVKCVYKVKVHEVNLNVADTTILAKGINENGIIKWKDAGYVLHSILYQNAFIPDANEVISFTSGHYFKEITTGKKFSLEQYTQYSNFNTKEFLNLIPKPDKPILEKTYDCPFVLATLNDFTICDPTGMELKIKHVVIPAMIKYVILD